MDRKKLQKLVNELSDELKRGESMVAESTAVMAVEAKQMVTESAGLVYSRDRNGDLIPEKGMFIGKDTYLCLDFDLEKFLKKYSLSTYDVLSCKFSIMGVSRPIRKGYSVYDREGNLFGNYEYDYVNHQYEVDLLALYKKSRNAGFKMLSDLDESFKKDSEQIVLITSKQDFLIKPVLRTDFEVVSLRISSPPEKLFYEPGELFDKNGMVIKGVFSDGEETLLTNYTYLPQIALTKEDIKISLFYEGKKTEQYICIGNKDNAYEPPLNSHSDYGVYIDTLRTEFLNVTAINGQTPVNPGENVEIELPGSVDVEVDLEGLLAANGLNQNPDMSFSLGIFGLLKNGNISYAYVNGYKSNTKIADLKGYNNMYFVPLSKLLAETGSASFRIFINPPKYYDKESDSYKASVLHEIFTLQKSFFISEKTSCETYLKVMTPPNKTRYMIGEKFDPIGMKVYEFNTNGFNREVKDYTYSPTESITQNSSIITIEYQGKTVKFPINIIGQSLPIRISQLSRNKIGDKWGDWVTQSSNNVVVSRNEKFERKTIVRIKKESILYEPHDKTGLRIFLDYQNDSPLTPHIKVNGVPACLSEYGSYVYVGHVNKGETGDLEITFSYADGDVYLSPGSKVNVYYCEAVDPAIQNNKKNYDLSGGAVCSVDLVRGKNTVTFTDIYAEETPLKVAVTHTYNSEENLKVYGKNFRLNLYERLDFSNAFEGPQATPVYTDGEGNQYPFRLEYHATIDGEDRVLDSDALKSVTLGENGFYWYKDKQLLIKHLPVQGYKFIYLNGRIESNTRYNELRQMSDGKEYLPANWIKDGNIYKGFNIYGRLNLIIDDFDNYIQIYYDSLERITSIEDGNGNKINLIYTNGKLTEINDTRDRKIKYSYNKDNLDTVTYLDADGVQTKKLEFGYSHVVLDGAGRKVLTGILDYGNNTYSNIRYEDNPVNARVVGIENYSKMTGTVDWNNGSKISAIAFAYDNGKTTVSDEYSNSEIYSFDTRGLLKSVYVLRDNLVTKAENYEYEPYVKQVVKTIAEEHLGVYYYDVFLDIEKQVSTKETLLNKINMPVKVTIDEIPLTNSSNKKVTVEYEYDFEFDLVKQISKEEYSDGSCFKFVTDIDYNYLKLPVKSVKRCYKVDDELETIEYTEVEERNYDKNGCVALTKNYRYAAGESADDAEVFYVEKAYNDNKQLIRETDDRGLYFNTFNYIKNTNLLSEINGPHGRNVSYRYDGSDRLSEVWAKTDNVNNVNTIEYVKGETKSIDHSGKNPIGFAYDDKHRLFTVTLDGTIIENYEYFDNVLIKSANGDRVSLVNSNGESFIAETTYNGKYEAAYYKASVNNKDKLIIERKYDGLGKLNKIKDNLSGTVANLYYDRCGNITNYIEQVGESIFEENYIYDTRGRIKQIEYSRPDIYLGRIDSFEYFDNIDGTMHKLSTGDYNVEMLNSSDNRYRGKKFSLKIRNKECNGEESVEYVNENSRATHLPERITYDGGNYIDYVYDGCENITEIRKNDVLVARYKYDSINRLVREDNSELNESYFYTYDENGNILKKRTYAYTLEDRVAEADANAVKYYGYDKDRLISNDEETFLYDNIGNPTTYRGKVLAWTMGRKLTRFNGVSYKYDGQGRRTDKNGIKYYYDSNGRLLQQSDGFQFFYDATGLLGFRYGNYYVYRKDLQGNIIGIIDINGEIVVNYTYDAWGNHKITDKDGNEVTGGIGVLNPFRYRSYYYDTETGLYYLQTRYYDPEIGRFINMDGIDYADPETINGLNLYAYCGNNPVMNIDPEGRAWWHWLIGAVIVAGLVAATIATAGGAAAGFAAIAAAASGTAAVGASVATTTLAFASVGAGVAYAASAAVGVMHGLESAINSGSVADGFATLMNYGESAMWNTVVGGVVGGIGGYFSHIEYGEKTPGKLHPWGTYHNTNDQTITHYNFRGNMSWSKHLTDHGNPKNHVVPHYHAEMPHTKAINNRGKLALELLRRMFGGK